MRIAAENKSFPPVLHPLNRLRDIALFVLTFWGRIILVGITKCHMELKNAILAKGVFMLATSVGGVAVVRIAPMNAGID